MPKKNRTILQEGIMSELLGEELKQIERGLRRTGSCLFLVLLLLLALVSSSYADQLCTLCHGPNGPHTPQCGDTTTCGVSCHQGKLDAIMHPSGAGTPISDSTTTTGISSACKTCHQLPGTTHPFRINTVPGTISVYPDLNQACGQCHGGGTDSAGSPPKTGVIYLTMNQLAVVAPNIHSGTTTSWLNTMDCTLCHNGSPIPPPVTNHQTSIGTPGTGAAACRNCHLANGILHQRAAVNVDTVCGQCHGGSNGAGAIQNGAPFFSDDVLAAFATDMHVSAASSTIPPTIGRTGMTLNGYTLSFTDASQVFSSRSTVTAPVSVNWGDGAVNTGATGAFFSHAYANGVIKTYYITHVVTDPVNPSLVTKATFSVNVPQRYTLVTVVTNSAGGAINGAQITLKKNGLAVQSAKPAGNVATFTNVLPGIYTVTAYKYQVINITTAPFDISSTPTVTITAP